MFQTEKSSHTDATTHAGTYSQCVASLLTRLSCMCGRDCTLQRNLYTQIPLCAHEQCDSSSCKNHVRRQTAHLCHLFSVFQNTLLRSFGFFPHALQTIGGSRSPWKFTPSACYLSSSKCPTVCTCLSFVRAFPSYVPSLRTFIPFVLTFYLYFLSCT